MHRKTHTVAALLAIIGMGAVGVGIAGIAQADGGFTIWRALFAVGQTLVILAAVLGVGLVTTRRNHTLDEAFDAGFRAGYRQGRRLAGMRVVPFRRGETRDEAI